MIYYSWRCMSIVNVHVIPKQKETLLFQKSKTNYWMKGIKNQVDEDEMILDNRRLWLKTDNAVISLILCIYFRIKGIKSPNRAFGQWYKKSPNQNKTITDIDPLPKSMKQIYRFWCFNSLVQVCVCVNIYKHITLQSYLIKRM